MFLSSYEMRARLTPGLLAMAPLSVSIVTLGLDGYPAVAVLGGLLTVTGGTYLLSVLVGVVGRRAEVALWSQWGGPPTTLKLRLREPTDNVVRRDKWRTDIAALTGVELLDEYAERRDPYAADQTIETAVGACRYLGHPGGDGHSMVRTENAQYGFERNLYAFRWVARAIAALATGAVVIALWTLPEIPRSTLVVGALINASLLVAWAVIPSRTRTAHAGDRYATQLLDAVGSARRKANLQGRG